MSKFIAWIDDENARLGPLMKLLKKEGYIIQAYRTYSEVLDKLNEIRRADLLVVDLILPPGNSGIEKRYLGVDLLKQLREAGLQQPVIVMSVVRPGVVEREMQPISGVIKFLDKKSSRPIEEELLQVVKSAICE